MKILMVCLGNICRSPLAEGLLASKVGDNVQVDSAGTGPWHIGHAPDERSVAVANKHGLDISNLRGRQLSVDDFERFDKIYVMDKSNYENVLKMAPSESAKSKVKMILDVLKPGENQEVPDPYYGGSDGFEKVYQMLDKATDKIAQQL